MDAPYEYQNFTLPREFRLLMICRDTLDESPRAPSVGYDSFELFTTTLDEAPQFQAVSYVWGSGDREVRLHFRQGGFLMITPRLANSLKELVKECSAGFLWIDQICINQEDEEDKAHQIPLMGDIYRLSAQVLVYLAPDLFPSVTIHNILAEASTDTMYTESIFTETRQRSLDYMRRAVAAYCDNDENRVSYDKIGSQLTRICNIRDQHEAQRPVSSGQLREQVVRETPYPWVFLYLFFKHPWFCRGWTVQEFVMAQKAIILTFGLSTEPTLLQAVLESADEEFYENPQLGCVPALFASQGSNRFVGVSTLRSNTLKNEQPSFAYVLDKVLSNSEVTVRQDSIYAFMAFLDKALQPPVDYSLSWMDLFNYVTTALARQPQSLFPLYYLQRESIRQWDGHESLPSWLPNWSEALSAKRSLKPSNLSRFCADMKRYHYHREHANALRLRVSGNVINSVEIIFAKSDHRSFDEDFGWLPEFLDFLRAMEREFDADIKLKKQHNSQGLLGVSKQVKRSGGSNDVAMRIIEGILRLSATEDFIIQLKTANDSSNNIQEDLSVFVRKQTDDILRDGLKLLIKKWHVFTSDEWAARSGYGRSRFRHSLPWDYTSKLRCHLEDLMLKPYRSNVFLSASGDFGYTYGSTVKGDLVCILHGSRVPVILRPANDSSDTTYKVIGWCYLDNAMFGEAVNWEEEEAQEFVLC
ncbi:HET-domain-containing protein [Lophiostoma macrostomum CBS 122681]|uniref:HET-domain-containing protein n=1 Tax=Lophiostoma macrostomum CBS 122681 TaxID=1314788 RepID=A0A6A6SPE2_9PLEO|nr:HET-domain-containing protein [Lophiostoma macrostomum CBS 122681]